MHFTEGTQRTTKVNMSGRVSPASIRQQMRTSLATQRYRELVEDLGSELNFQRGWLSRAADRLGVSKSYISRLRSEPDLEVGMDAIERAVEKLKIDRSFFFSQQDAPPHYADFTDPHPSKDEIESLGGSSPDPLRELRTIETLVAERAHAQVRYFRATLQMLWYELEQFQTECDRGKLQEARDHLSTISLKFGSVHDDWKTEVAGLVERVDLSMLLQRMSEKPPSTDAERIDALRQIRALMKPAVKVLSKSTDD